MSDRCAAPRFDSGEISELQNLWKYSRTFGKTGVTYLMERAPKMLDQHRTASAFQFREVQVGTGCALTWPRVLLTHVVELGAVPLLLLTH